MFKNKYDFTQFMNFLCDISIAVILKGNLFHSRRAFTAKHYLYLIA